MEMTRSMVRANSALKIAGPRHGTMSSRTFGASSVTFSISGGTSSSTARSGIIRRKRRSLRRGVEIVRDEQPAHLIERLRQRAAQRLRPRRQFHPCTGPHQKRIADQVAQPLQRVARRRLRQADPHRGAADAGFPEQRVERDQQIEVKRIQIHEVNRYHIHYRLEECRSCGDNDPSGFSNGGGRHERHRQQTRN